MAYPEYRGQPNKVHNTGILIYGGDGTTTYPIKLYDSDGRPVISQREPFIFRPGNTALSGGMVESGTRSSATTTTSGTVANSTYWSGWYSYAPLRSGKIDGLSSGGIVDGQLTIGVKTSAGTGTARLTARIANTANTAAPTTCLTQTSTITVTTAEIFKTYDIPYLATNTVFNAVPFSLAIGGDHQQASSSIVFRLMESSYVQGEYEPGT